MAGHTANHPSSPVALPYYIASIVGVAVGVVMISMAVGLVWWQSLALGVGVSLVVWGVTFTVLEVRRIAGISTASRTPDEIEAYRNRHRAVLVLPPTDEPCIHHENCAESPGMDQGQLTSNLPAGTPLIDRLLHARGRRVPS